MGESFQTDCNKMNKENSKLIILNFQNVKFTSWDKPEQ